MKLDPAVPDVRELSRELVIRLVVVVPMEELSAEPVEEVSPDNILVLVISVEDGVTVDVISLVDENSCEVGVAVKVDVVRVDVSKLPLLVVVSNVLPLDVSSEVVKRSEEESDDDELVKLYPVNEVDGEAVLIELLVLLVLLVLLLSPEAELDTVI